MPSIIDDIKTSAPSSPTVANPIGASGMRGRVTGVTRIGARAGIIAIVALGGIVAAIFYGVSSGGTHPKSNVTAAAAPQILATDAPLIDDIPGAVASAHPIVARGAAPHPNVQPPTPQPVSLPATQAAAAQPPSVGSAAGNAAQGAAQMSGSALAQAAQMQPQPQDEAALLRAQQAANAAQAKRAQQEQIAEAERGARQSAILIGANASNSTTTSAQQSGTTQATVSPYVVQEGSIIPATLVTGINSDLPGIVTALVNQDVYDSQSGHFLLIPAGSKLLGQFESQVVAGQSRVNVSWHRIIYPNGNSVDISGAEGADAAGYSGFTGKVDKHTNILGTVLSSIIGIGAAIASEPRVVVAPVAGTAVVMQPTVGQQVATQAGGQLQQNVSQLTGANNQQQRPTIEVRPGYIFNVLVNRDLVLAAPYKNS